MFCGGASLWKCGLLGKERKRVSSESSASERVAKTLPATTAWAAPTLAALAGRGHKRGFAAVSQLEELRFGSLLNLGLTAPLTEPTVFLRASVSTAQAPASSCILPHCKLCHPSLQLQVARELEDVGGESSESRVCSHGLAEARLDRSQPRANIGKHERSSVGRPARCA